MHPILLGLALTLVPSLHANEDEFHQRLAQALTEIRMGAASTADVPAVTGAPAEPAPAEADKRSYTCARTFLVPECTEQSEGRCLKGDSIFHYAQGTGEKIAGGCLSSDAAPAASARRQHDAAGCDRYAESCDQFGRSRSPANEKRRVTCEVAARVWSCEQLGKAGRDVAEGAACVMGDLLFVVKWAAPLKPVGHDCKAPST